MSMCSCQDDGWDERDKIRIIASLSTDEFRTHVWGKSPGEVSEFVEGRLNAAAAVRNEMLECQRAMGYMQNDSMFKRVLDENERGFYP